VSTPERWKPVPQHLHYEVSSQGRLRNTKTGRVLRPQCNTSGYPSARLGRGTPVRIHRLVAEAFCPRSPGCTIVNHTDGDRANNCAENLEWVSYAGNANHATYTSHRVRTLTIAQVNRLRELYAQGEHSQEELADMFGIPRPYVSNIVTGYCWKGLAQVPRIAQPVAREDAAEEWTVCAGFPDYDISSHGRLLRRDTGRILSPIRLALGYLQYKPRKDGKTHQEYAHRLVLLTFAGEPPKDMRCPNVNHLNNRRDDNRLCNLEWTAHRHNLRHRYAYPYQAVSGPPVHNNEGGT